MIAARMRSPVFIGRAEELRALASRRVAAARGKGGCVVISGDAGIGKSRLVGAFRETLRGVRAAVGLGIAREFGNAPYGPLREALCAAGIAPDSLPGLGFAAQIAAITDGLRAVCARRQCILILEDAHWADEASLRALLHVASLTASTRLLLVITYRSGNAPQAPALRAFLTRLNRFSATLEMSLEPLAPRDVRELIAGALGDRRLPAATVAEIVERSEGNPFFAEELLKSACRSDPIGARSAVSLPPSIRDAVLDRCASLTGAQRRLVERCAVLGRRFEASLLSAVCGTPLHETLEGLRKLRDLEFIFEIDGDPPSYAFHHELTREALYGTLLLEQRRPLHRSILRALEGRGAPPFDLGYHAWAGRSSAASLRYNEIAGDEALAVQAYADARICYERALEAAAEDGVRAALLQKSAEAAAADGAADRAASLYRAAAETFERRGDAARSTDAYVAMSSQARSSGETVLHRSVLQTAMAALPPQRRIERARLSLALAFTHLDRCDAHAAEQLIACSDAAAGTPAYASACNYAAAVHGDVAAVRRASALYVARCEAEGAAAALQARFNAFFSLCVLGFDDDACNGFAELLPELRRRRLRSLEILTLANLALAYARAARWTDARDCVERGLAIPEPATTGPAALAAAGLTVAEQFGDDRLALRTAPPETIAAAFESRINSTLGRVAGPYARWRRRLGKRDEAERALDDALRSLAGAFGATETLLAAAEFGADDARRRALAIAASCDGTHALPLYAATAAQVRALDAQRNGDASLAREHAQRAAGLYRELRWPEHERRVARLACLPARTPSAAAQPATDCSTTRLSARELQVAALVAQGIPNRGLAQRLAVSQRTVEKHLTSIFDKLGLQNRTELTALMVRRSLQ